MSPDATALFASPLQPLAETVGARLRRLGIKLTLGGEPTLVPDQPDGAEWNVAAVGPTKLGYAYELAAELIRTLPARRGHDLLSRQTLPRRGQPALGGQRPCQPRRHSPRPAHSPPARSPSPPPASSKSSGPVSPEGPQAQGRTTGPPRRTPPTAPGAWPSSRSTTTANAGSAERWPLPKGRKTLLLIDAEGPAGLRLPLADLPPAAMRRALTLETRARRSAPFHPPAPPGPLPPTARPPHHGCFPGTTAPTFSRVICRQDDGNLWTRVGLTADPGVLEINLPPCETWHDYHRWLAILEETGATVGLRSWKDFQPGDPGGTGGGNHLLFGGPTVEENPFFTRPAWVASLLRYFQAHPCLAYLVSRAVTSALPRRPPGPTNPRATSTISTWPTATSRVCPPAIIATCSAKRFATCTPTFPATPTAPRSASTSSGT